jgi:AcrR family transcriptional regulator
MVIAGPPTGLRERKRQQTRARLAAATVELVAEKGLAEARIEDICDRAETGRSTFFRYFDSKESAFVHGTQNEGLASLVERLACRPISEPPLDALRHALLQGADDWPGRRERLLLEARLRAESPTMRAWSSANHIAWTVAIAEVLRSRDPDAKPDDLGPMLLASLVMTALWQTADRWLAEGAHGSPSRQMRASWDAVSGFLASAGG